METQANVERGMTREDLLTGRANRAAIESFAVVTVSCLVEWILSIEHETSSVADTVIDKSG